jgi:NtrC-family two-component system sensor histidine kinase KinB
VNEEMQRLMQLINDLLNFSRYQNGLQKLTLAPCSIEDLLEQARLRFAEGAEQKGIELLVEVQGRCRACRPISRNWTGCSTT